MSGWPEDISPAEKDFSSLHKLLDRTLIKRADKKKKSIAYKDFNKAKEALTRLRNVCRKMGCWESAITIEIILEQDLKNFMDKLNKEKRSENPPEDM